MYGREFTDARKHRFGGGVIDSDSSTSRYGTGKDDVFHFLYVDLGFAAGECVTALTEVTDGGVPEIVNMVDQCFELPNLPSFPMSICDNTCSS